MQNGIILKNNNIPKFNIKTGQIAQKQNKKQKWTLDNNKQRDGKQMQQKSVASSPQLLVCHLWVCDRRCCCKQTENNKLVCLIGDTRKEAALAPKTGLFMRIYAELR